MRAGPAGQNIFLEKVPFLENNKSIKKMCYLRFDFLPVFIGIKENIFFNFLPLGYFDNMVL